jgi:dCTP deaminase
MSLISYNGLVQLVESGVINAEPDNINGASIDITLGNVVRFECVNPRTVDIRDASLSMVIEEGDQFYIRPGEFCLAETREVFNLPNNIAAEYKLKSSMARNGLNHLLAGWCDPGWYGSTLTLELHNVTQYHTIKLCPGIKIGQMVFYEVEPVPEEKSYKTKGQYNNQKGAQESKGVR